MNRNDSPRLIAILSLGLLALCATGIAKAQSAWNSNTVTWTASVGCVSGPATGCPVTGYRVERSATQGGTYAAVGTATAPPFTHANAAAGLNCYRVIALSAAGNSAPSTVTANSCRTNVEPSGPPNPPTDVTVIATTAYNVRPNLQRFAFERGSRYQGTVKLGAACDETRTVGDGYYVISRLNMVSPRPPAGTVLVAKCG